jgi:SAM-dependent MidA family methyltransferase
VPVETHIAQAAAEVGTHVSFRRFMDRCLFDPASGYYAAGRVDFGHAEHFSTFPQRMSPLFGHMVADAARHLIEALELPDGVPLTLLELGAGDGHLAADVLTRLEALQDDPDWDFAGRVRYVIGERSDALASRQRIRLAPFIASGRAEVRSLDAADLRWDGPFYGLVICNELIDAFSCELLQIDASSVSRVHVRERPGQPIDELLVPLDLGWFDGPEPGSVPQALHDRLTKLAPLIDDLAACDLLPTRLCWSPSTERFMQSLGRLLQGPDRRGLAMLVDYGGTSRHVLDPRSLGPHLRVYGEGVAHQARPYDRPGEHDITWDVDFTELADLARSVGLKPLHYGHQSMLEGGGIDLWSPKNRERVIAAHLRLGHEPEAAAIEAELLVSEFREASGFCVLTLGPADVEIPVARFGPSDLVEGRGLDTIARSVPVDQLTSLATAMGIEAPGSVLQPCCDVVANLSDHDAYHLRDVVLQELEARGYLRRPGRVGHG